jgi:hypothetical protein
MIMKNISIFNKILNQASIEDNVEQELILLSIASYFATYNYIGDIYSNEIEDKLINISKNIFIEKRKNIFFKENSCLHVVTEFYLHGGHSRVIERWMDFDNNSANSVAIIKPENSQISEDISKHNIYLIDEKSYIDKAKVLFDISQKYEYIVLHTHMYDIVPILIFGQQEVKSKVFYYNQADHLFWIGRKIVDKIIDISSEGQEITRLYRNILNKEKNIVLPVPLIENKHNKRSTRQVNLIKNTLNIDIDKKVIVTAGSTARFMTSEYSIIDAYNDIENNLSNFIFIVVGSNEEDIFWQNVRNNNNIIIVDTVTNFIFDKYVAIADVYIESFPFSSSTSSLEMIMNDVISVLVEDDFPQFDSYTNFTIKKESVSSHVVGLLSDINYYKQHLNSQEKIKNKIIEEHFKDRWLNRKNNIFNSIYKKEGGSINNNKIINYEKNLYRFLQKSYSNTILYKQDFFKLNFLNKIQVINFFGIRRLVASLIRKLKIKI